MAEQEKKVENYRRIIQSCDPVGEFVNEQVATVNFLYCHEDEAQGVATGQRFAQTFGYMAAQLVSAREAFPSRSYASFGLLPQVRRQSTAPGEQPGVPRVHRLHVVDGELRSLIVLAPRRSPHSKRDLPVG